MEEKQNPYDPTEQEMVEESDDSSRLRPHWFFMLLAVSVVVTIYMAIYYCLWVLGPVRPGFAPN